MLGKLYIVSTPIGNLNDISERAIEVLGSVSLILTEDTRVTSKLLKHYDIKTHTLSFNHYASKDQQKLEMVIAKLLAGEDIALVTDAGTPGISDPGNELIDYIYNYLGTFQNDLASVGILATDRPTRNSEHDKSEKANVNVIPIPGPSALTAALSVCGFNVQSFTFLGFLPKKKLTKLLKEVSDDKRAFAYFDSPHRVVKNLEKLKEVVGTGRRVFIARELTKAHETHYRGTIDDVINTISINSVKGEVAVVVEGK